MKKPAKIKSIARRGELARQKKFPHSEMLVVIFPKSPSIKLGNAMIVARAADAFEERQDEAGRPLYLAAFRATAPSLNKAHELLKCCATWKGTMTFFKGTQRMPWKMHYWLECYVTAVKCKDKKAHCYTSAGLVESDEKIIVSCKHAVNYSLFHEPEPTRTVDFLPPIVSTLEAQLEAKAVDYECEICPLFKCKVLQTKKIKGTTRYWD